MIKQNTPPTLIRAIFSLTAIIGVLIFSGIYLQSLKQKISTSYDLSNSGLIDQNGNNSITTIALNANDQLWVGNPDGVFTLTPDGTWKTYTTSNSKLPFGSVSALTIDDHNRVWVGTTSGLGMLTPQDTWETFLNERVFALATDQQGGLWVATEKKISLLSNSQWTDYTSENSGLSTPSYALVVDQNRQVWTTNRFRIDILTAKGNWTKGIADNVIQPRYNGIRALAIDNQNRIWVGTENGLVECISGKCAWYSPQLKSVLNLSRPELTYDVHALAFDAENRLWGSTGGGMYILDVFRASLFQRLVSLQWLENLLLFVLAYIYGVRQLPKKNNLLIGGLGGSLAYIMMGVSFKLPIQLNIFLPLLSASTLSIGIVVIAIGLIISIVVSMVAGFIGGKIGGEIVAYISGGAGVVTLFVILLLAFALAFAQ